MGGTLRPGIGRRFPYPNNLCDYCQASLCDWSRAAFDDCPAAFYVTDDDGQTAVNSASITINDITPTANAGGNQSGNEGTGVSLHGSGTTAPGDAIISYAWDLDNNGTFEVTDLRE